MSHVELEEITDKVDKITTEIKTSINRSINVNTKPIPKKENADANDQTIEDYTQEFAMNLLNEEGTNKRQFMKYQEILDEQLDKLYNFPVDKIIGQKALKTIDEIHEKKSEVKELIKTSEERLNKRYKETNELREKEGKTPLQAYTFNIKEAASTRKQNPDRSTVHHTTTNSYQTNTKSVLNMKGIDIPIFYGDIEEWPHFYLVFKDLVADDETIPNVMKHNMLRSHVKGAPFELVKPYQPDGTKFQIALDRLIKVYGSPEKQYEHLWNKLINLPVSKEHPESLRTTHNEIYAIVNGLKSYGTKEVEAQMFQAVIRNKIPKRILTECLKNNPENTTELLEEFDEVITREELVYRSINRNEKEERTILSIKNSTQKNPCKYCNRNNHTTKECRTVATMEKRKEFIRQNKLCYNCLKSGHQTKECRSSACRTCNTKHNTSICPKNINSNTQNYKNQNKNTNSNYTNNQQYNQNKNQKQQYQNQQSYQYNKQQQNNFQKNYNSQQNQYNNHNKQYQNNYQNKQNSNQYNNYQNRQNSQNYNQNFKNNQKRNLNFASSTLTDQIDTNKEEENQQVHNYNITNSFHMKTAPTSLMIAKAPILINKDITHIPVLLDSGADESFILEKFAEDMNLKIIENDISIDISVFGKNPTTIKTNKVEFEILTNKETIIVEALTVPKITDFFNPIELTREDVEFLRNQEKETINITRPEAPIALIGCDIFWRLIKNEDKIQLPSGRYLIPTHMGNLICGKQDNTSATSTHAMISRIHKQSSERINETTLEEFFEIHNIGITGEQDFNTNEEVIKHFNKTVKINQETKRISVALPWKTGYKELLDNNRDVAFCRLKSQFNAIHKQEFWKKLSETFKTMEETGIIEEIDNDPNEGYYIPYQLVFNEGSNTTKMRTVFDASSKKQGERSLNNCLHQGPSLVPALQGILLRIRSGKYILSGDIEKAFHAVEIQQQDRDALRFLWLKDSSKPPSNENIRLMRFRRLPFGVNCSPYLLSMAIQHGIEKSNAPKALKKAIHSMCYVDNVFLVSDSIQELEHLYKKSKEHFKEMGMNIREFSINGPDKFIKDEDRTSNEENVKILGYLYDIKKDILQVKKPKIQMEEGKVPRMTKRKVVSELTKYFDPLQLFAPLYLEAKEIIRSISQSSIKWTHIVSNETVQRVIKYREKIENCTLQFQRNIPHNKTNPLHLAIFTDASKTTYGANVYLIVEKEKGQHETHLLIAKQRVAPQTKTVTIPRLELIALLIGIRLLKYVIEEIHLKIDNIDIYSDSNIAIHQMKAYDKGIGKMETFVENRCHEMWTILENIQKVYRPNQIKISHVPTDENPADHITRGAESEEELRETNWFTGPEWLSNDNSENHPDKKSINSIIIPCRKLEKYPPDFEPEVIDKRFRTLYNKSSYKANHVYYQSIRVDPKEIENKVIPVSRINNFYKCTRIMALAMRYLKHRILNKISLSNQELLKRSIPELKILETLKSNGQLKLEELKQAEKLMIRNCQKAYFRFQPNLQKKTYFPLDDKYGKRYKAIIEQQNYDYYQSEKDGLIYAKSRVHNVPDKPFIITQSHLATTIIVKTHRESLHAGPGTTLGNILQKYGGTGWKKHVKKQLKHCITCRKENNHRYPEAPPGNIPERRTTKSRPFEHIGIDFMGPIKTQKRSTTETEEAHVALFTCCATRLVHLELVHDLSTDEFLLALSRFTSRRGFPASITTDNAATFTLTSAIMARCSKKHDMLMLRSK